MWVMRALPADASDEDRHLALLHDVVEDCRKRLAILMVQMQMEFDPANPVVYLDFFRRRGYSSYVVEGLMLLTRDMWSGSYMSYIRNIIASGHHGAMWIKYTWIIVITAIQHDWPVCCRRTRVGSVRCRGAIAAVGWH